MTAVHKKERNDTANAVGVRLPVGLFAWAPEAIAESLASKEISPQGPASGMRLLTFYISHTGRVLSASRRRNLEKAKKLLSARVEQALRAATGSPVTGVEWE